MTAAERARARVDQWEEPQSVTVFGVPLEEFNEVQLRKIVARAMSHADLVGSIREPLRRPA